MKAVQKLVANLVFSLNILVLFFFLFGSRMEFPAWVQSVGRMHPLLLHLPIGIFIITALLVAFQSQFKRKSLRKLIVFSLGIAALTASLSALMGLILSAEGGYNDDIMGLHRWAGVSMSLLSGVTMYLYTDLPEKRMLFNGVLVASLFCLVLTGHWGATLTHGENYILQPLTSTTVPEVTISDSASLFEAAIFPIIENKCTSCHNENKAKGKLVMTSLSPMLKGGEHGELWKAGAPESSLLMRKLLLPEDHKEHMPPKGKPQLNVLEVQLLYQWILAGADTLTEWTKFDERDSVRRLAELFIHRSQREELGPQYEFAHASEETIQQLNNPYRTVASFALEEPALKADFFLRKEYQPRKLEELLAVKEQLVILNLSGMPVMDQDCKTIRQFSNLEKLNLNFTLMTTQGLSALSDLEKLQSISLAGTALSKAELRVLSEFPALKEAFIWNTKVSESEVAELQSEMPSIIWNTGFIPDEKEILRLTPPLLVNENMVIDENGTIILKHNLPGTIVRYSVDGSEPDTLNGKIYEKPLTINGLTRLKAKACKPGWFCSNMVEHLFFKKGVLPAHADLLNQPDKDYKGEGAATLIDNKKGYADNFRDIAWLGFREKPFAAEFTFDSMTTVKSITISYARNVYSYLMPPERVEVWAGDNSKKLKLIRELKPDVGKDDYRTLVMAIPIELDRNKHFTHYKIIAHPIVQLPAWHPGKGKKGWVFVDEVFFN